MTINYSDIYGHLRQKILSQNFALGRYWRNNYMSQGAACSPSGFKNDIEATCDRTVRLLRLTCLKQSASSPAGVDDVSIHVVVEDSARPRFGRKMNDRELRVWDLNLSYPLSHASQAMFKLYKSGELIGTLTVPASAASPAPIPHDFDNGDCHYELQFEVGILDPPQVSVVGGPKEVGDVRGTDTPKDAWHIVNHGRENPLIASGQLLALLAIEHSLGNPEAVTILQAALSAIGSLYKFKHVGEHFAGYIIRWDAVTSDLWYEEAVGDAIFPRRCLNFFTDEHGNYLYCTPFTHPEYIIEQEEGECERETFHIDMPRALMFVPELERLLVSPALCQEFAERNETLLSNQTVTVIEPGRCWRLVSTSDEKKNEVRYFLRLDGANLRVEKVAYASEVRYPFLVRYRHWEPSIDEINGLIMGYDMVYRFVDVPVIRSIVQEQARWLGDYLAEYAYLLVRPGGGFSARGHSGPNPAFEFIYSEAFKRITGQSYGIRRQDGWVYSVTKAGVWQHAGPSITSQAAALGWGAAVLSPLVGPAVESLVAPLGLTFGRLLGEFQITPQDLAFAAAIELNKHYFDVQSSASDFALSYILLRIPADKRIGLWMLGCTHGMGSFARNFPRFWGFAGMQIPGRSDNADPRLPALFLPWYDAYYKDMLDRKAEYVADPAGQKDGWWNSNRSTMAWDCALALLNGAGTDLEARLVTLLNDPDTYAPSQDEATLGDNELSYMCGVAAAWLYRKLQQEQGHEIHTPGFPSLPDTTTWSKPAVPVQPTTYVIIGSSFSEDLSLYENSIGRSVDFGSLDKSWQAQAYILIAPPSERNPLPLDWVQPWRDQEHLALDRHGWAALFDTAPTVSKPPEPVPTAIRPFGRTGDEPVVISGDFNGSNLTVTTRKPQVESKSITVFSLLFHPNSPGDYSGTFVYRPDSPYLPEIEFSLSARVNGPQVTVTPPQFGEVVLNVAQVKELWARNDGAADAYCSLSPMLTGETYPGDFEVVSPAIYEHFMLAPGESTHMSLQYCPQHAGSSQAHLELTVDRGSGLGATTIDVLLQGTGKALLPTIQVSPTSIDFGRVSFKQEGSVDLKIQNAGDGDLVMTAIHVEPEVDFFIDIWRSIDFWLHRSYDPNDLPKTLAPGETLPLVMLFHPDGIGHTSTGALVIDSNDPRQPRVSVPLTGVAPGTWAELRPEGPINFGTVALPALIPVERQVQICCKGSDPLHITRVFVSPADPAFKLRWRGRPPFTIAPGQSLTLGVAFQPKRRGHYEAYLEIESDAFTRLHVLMRGEAR